MNEKLLYAHPKLKLDESGHRMVFKSIFHLVTEDAKQLPLLSLLRNGKLMANKAGNRRQRLHPLDAA
jgi:hypothetical protein